MKLYLIAVLFLASLIAAPCLAEEQAETAATGADVPESVKSLEELEAPPGSTGDEQQSPQDTPESTDEDKKVEDNDDDVKIPEELQDEVQEVKKRGVPQLSARSCSILKRYGFCRNAAIARFCVAQCCHDKLSLPSCRKVKFTYRQCNHAIGRVYCQRTCGHCGGGPKLPVQCRSHKVINDNTRRQSLPRGNVLKCDSKIAEGWYRFLGQQGTVIPNKCVPSNRCGTHAPLWVVGNYPTVRGQTVTRQVCGHWSNNCCYNSKWWKIYIQITNCGGYYVFYLRRPRACSYRYCGNA